MASIPAEIDLFTIPHCRMKELVNTYTQKVQCVDFRNCEETFNLLKELQATFYEFKSHEYIENLFIMEQLKNRLKQRHIYNSAVCDCHKDNRLSKMMNLVRNSKHLQRCSIGERVNFGEELQKCFFDFVQEFLPHMEEEENIFQPLMVEHFGYDELCALKEVVIEQHELIRDPFYHEKAELDSPEIDSNIKDFRDIDSDVCYLGDLYEDPYVHERDCEEDKIFDYKEVDFEGFGKENYYNLSPEQHLATSNIYSSDSLNLPVEILVKIFWYLSPLDRGRCALVCSFWNEVIFTPLLWREIYPIQWARGIWQWEDAKLHFLLEDEASKNSPQRDYLKYDEDADIDETENCLSPLHQEEYSVFSSIISFLLPKVGKGVEKIVLDAGKGISSRQIRRALILCPNVTYLSASYTPFSYHTIKGLNNMRCLSKLRYLDLQGCVEVDDLCLDHLSECLRKSEKAISSYALTCCLDNEDDNYSDQELLCSSCPIFNWHLNQDSYKSSNDSSVASNGYNKWNGEGKCVYHILNSESQEPEIEELASVETKVGTESSLEYLNLSGCLDITEKGLYYLFNEGALLNINYLNVSGCFDIVGYHLTDIVKQCPYLQAKNISYCNQIADGPHPSEASGCDTINHVVKKCCQAFVY